MWRNTCDEHLFTECAVTNSIWNSAWRWAGFAQTISTSKSLKALWFARRKESPKQKPEKAELFVHVGRLVNLARKEQVFEKVYKPLPQLIDQIQSEGQNVVKFLAAAKLRSDFLFLGT
jgi:hypothetical protein